MENVKSGASGLIVTGDLPRWKIVSLLWVTYLDGKNKNGPIVMGDLSKCKIISL